MSDRTSAGIFGDIFNKLASDPTPQHIDWAHDFWRSQQRYDFSPYQMECDKALITLGLARRGIDPDEPNEPETTLYGPITPGL